MARNRDPDLLSGHLLDLRSDLIGHRLVFLRPFLQLFLIFFIGFAVCKEPSDHLPHSFHEMSVDHFCHTLCHFHTDGTMCHLCNAAEWHIINEEDIQIRFSLILTFLFQICENLVDHSCQSALCIIHLADCVIHSQFTAPLSIRDRLLQKCFKFCIRYISDNPREI